MELTPIQLNFKVELCPVGVGQCELGIKQQTVVVCVTTPDDDGVRRGQMLSTVDRRPSPVDHSYRPALCTSLWRLDIRDGVVHFCWR